MGEWKECELGDITSSNNRSIDRDYKHKIIKYLDTGSITCGNISGYQELKLKDAPSRAKRLVQHEDIIYSTVRPIQKHYGFIMKPQDNLVVSTGFSVLETNKKLADPKFVYYFLTANNTVEELDIIAEASTTTYPSIKPSDIGNLDILLPSLPEQKAIAGVLSSLDDKIDLLYRQNKTLESMAETLFRQWFVEEAKEEWEEDEIGKYVSVVDNRGKTPPNQMEKTPYPLIEVNSLGKENRLVDYSVIRKYVLEETYKTWFRGRPEKYDILISTVGSIGALSMFIIKKGNVAQNVISLHATKISPFYLYQVLKFRVEEILQLDIGGVQPSIKVPHLLAMAIPIPSKEKQLAFDNQVINFVNKMEYNYMQICTLKKLRDTLLPKIMSGEVRLVG